MAVISRERAIREHRKMWRWLAENPGQYKSDYVRSHIKNKRLRDALLEGSFCFLCVYVNSTPRVRCSDCPLDWGGIGCMSKNAIDDGEGYFAIWSSAIGCYDDAKAAEMARVIAELPEKKVVAV